jgi:hypothetical protein
VNWLEETAALAVLGIPLAACLAYIAWLVWS